MNLDQARAFLVSLPHVAEAEQFGGLIYWLGDKSIGGKMFAHLNIEPTERYRIAFPAGPERFAELVEQDGFAPAPYLARAWWVAAERWDAFRHADWEAELLASHTRTFEKLPPKTKRLLALPPAELKRAIAEALQANALKVRSK